MRRKHREFSQANFNKKLFIDYTGVQIQGGGLVLFPPPSKDFDTSPE